MSVATLWTSIYLCYSLIVIIFVIMRQCNGNYTQSGKLKLFQKRVSCGVINALKRRYSNTWMKLQSNISFSLKVFLALQCNLALPEVLAWRNILLSHYCIPRFVHTNHGMAKVKQVLSNTSHYLADFRILTRCIYKSFYIWCEGKVETILLDISFILFRRFMHRNSDIISN